jgi:hypothetical protein
MPVRKGPDCVGDEMARFGRGELHSGKGGKVVTDPKQAKAISLSACGQSKYSEVLQGMGFPADVSDEVTAMFAEIDWAKQFRTGKGPGPENPENYQTGMTTKKGRGQLRIGKGPGDMGKLKVNSDSEMLSPVSYPRGPGNPQSGSSKEVFGMRALG